MTSQFISVGIDGACDSVEVTADMTPEQTAEAIVDKLNALRRFARTPLRNDGANIVTGKNVYRAVEV